MVQWYESYSDFFQGVILVAGVFTLILIIQIIMLLIGMDDDTSFDSSDVSDVDDAVNDGGFLDLFGLRVLTLRNFIAFFAIGGWSTIAFLDWTQIAWLSIMLGIIIGIITMFLMAYIFKKMNEFQEVGNVDFNNAIGKVGTVYLFIPKSRSGRGKVNVIVQDRYVEIEAVTDGDLISTGEEIRVVDCLGDYVVVEKVNK